MVLNDILDGVKNNNGKPSPPISTTPGNRGSSVTGGATTSGDLSGNANKNTNGSATPPRRPSDDPADPPDDKLKTFYKRLRSRPSVRGLPDDYGQFKSALADTTTRRAFYGRLRDDPAIRGIPDEYERFNSLWGAEGGNTAKPPTAKDDTRPEAVKRGEDIHIRGEMIGRLQQREKQMRSKAEALKGKALSERVPSAGFMPGVPASRNRIDDPKTYKEMQGLLTQADALADRRERLQDEQLYATGSPEDRAEMDEGTLRKTVEEFAKGVGRGIVNLPKSLATIGANFNQNEENRKELREWQQWLQRANESDWLKSDREFENASLESVYDKPLRLIPYLSGKVGESAPTMLPGLGAAKILSGAGKAAQIAGAALASTPIETAGQLEDLENTAAEEGRSPTAGEKTLAVATGMLSGVLEGVADASLMRGILKGLDKTGLDDAAKEAAKKEIANGLTDIALRASKESARGFGVEGATEGVQQVIGNVGARFGWDKDRGYFEGVPESMVVGGLTGAPISGVGTAVSDVVNKRRHEESVERAKRDQLNVPYKDSFTRQEEQARQEAQRKALNVPYKSGAGPGSNEGNAPSQEGTTQQQEVQPEIKFTYDPEAAPDAQLEQLNREEQRLANERARAADAGQNDVVAAYDQALQGIAEVKGEVESKAETEVEGSQVTGQEAKVEIDADVESRTEQSAVSGQPSEGEVEAVKQEADNEGLNRVTAKSIRYALSGYSGTEGLDPLEVEMDLQRLEETYDKKGKITPEDVFNKTPGFQKTVPTQAWDALSRSLENNPEATLKSLRSAFENAKQNDRRQSEKQEAGSSPLEVGQVGQWTSQGVDQFAEPRPITDIQEDADGNQFVQFEGSTSYAPAAEVQVEQQPAQVQDETEEVSNENKSQLFTEAKTENDLLEEGFESNPRMTLLKNGKYFGRETADGYKEFVELNGDGNVVDHAKVKTIPGANPQNNKKGKLVIRRYPDDDVQIDIGNISQPSVPKGTSTQKILADNDDIFITTREIYESEVAKEKSAQENENQPGEAISQSPSEVKLTEPVDVSEGRYRVENDPESDNASQVRLVDSETGEPLSRSSRNFNPAFAEFLTGEQMQGVPRVNEQTAGSNSQPPAGSSPASSPNEATEDVSFVEGDTYEGYLKTVANESRNPMELIEAYEDAQILKDSQGDSESRQVFQQELSSIRTQDIARVMGSNFLPDNRILYTRTSDTATPLDVQAQILSDQLNREVTEQDIIEFMLDDLRRSSRFTQLRDNIKERFRDVTGVGLTESLVNAVQQRQVQEFLQDDGSIIPDVQGLIDNYIDDTGRIDYTALWEQELQDDSGKGFFTGFPGDLTEEQYQRLKDEVEQEAKREAEGGGPQARPDGPAEAGSSEAANRSGPGQVSGNEQQAARGQQRIDTILDGKDVGPIEEDLVLGNDADADNNVGEEGNVYGQTKQYTEAEGPDGQPIGYVSLAQESKSTDPAQGELQFGAEGNQEDASPNTLGDEFYTVKRGYRPDKNWKLTGRSSQIRNIDDVAYLMRTLETSSVEQLFVVAVGGDGQHIVLHVSSGTSTAALTDYSAIQDAINKVDATDVYFVHNHPSGNLKASDGDQRQFEIVDKMFSGTTHGIIMDAYKGEYLIFDPTGANDRVIERPTDAGEDVLFEVQRFDQAIYTQPVEAGSLTSPSAVAAFLTGSRYSIGDKTVAILLSNSKEINAVVPLTDTTETGILEKVKQLMPTYNSESVVLAGRKKGINVHAINRINRQLQIGNVEDYVMVDTSAGNVGNYRSMRTGRRGSADRGRSFVSDAAVREPGTSFERQQLERQFEQAKKEYSAAQTAFKNKQRKLEGRLADDRENLFGERRTDSSTSMFDMRADPAQVEKTLKPFRDRREVAKQQVNRLAKKLEQLSDERQPDLFDSPTAVREAALPSNFKSFNEAIEKYWNGDLAPSDILTIARPSEKLQTIGISNQPIIITQRILNKVSGKDPVGREIINNLPAIVNNPMMKINTYDSDSRPSLISPIQTSDGPLLIALNLNSKKGNVEVTDIRSVYGKREGDIVRWISEGKLEAADKNKALQWLDQLPGSNSPGSVFTAGRPKENIRSTIENSNDIPSEPQQGLKGNRLSDTGAAYSSDIGESGTNPGRTSPGPGDPETPSGPAGSTPVMVTDANGVEREVRLGHLDKIHGMAMPEMVRLVNELTGAVPGISTRFRSSRGKFYPVEGGKIALSADIFQETTTATKVLAHEIGHLIDYLPDETMSRGNLLGRLKSLRRFLKTTAEGSQSTGPGLTKKDRQRIRNEATKAVIAEEGTTLSEYIQDADLRKALSDKIKSRYQTYIKQEIADRKLLTQEGLFNELYGHSKDWRPFDENAVNDSYRRYRRSSEELYADALSALLTSPGTLEQNAPTFYNEFFAQLEEKPEVKSVFLETQAYLNGGNDAVQALRNETIEAAYQKAEAKTKELIEERKKAGQSWVSYVRQGLEDKWHPIIKKLDEAEKAGKTLPVDEDPRYLLQELDYADNASTIYLYDVGQQVVNPIEQAGMSTMDLHKYLLFNRIANEGVEAEGQGEAGGLSEQEQEFMERSDKELDEQRKQYGRAFMANPGGLTAETAQEQLDYMRDNLSAEKFEVLEQAARRFQELNFAQVEEAVEAGTYNREIFEKLIKPNKYNYATFRVIDYIEYPDYVNAAVKAGKGTFKEVGSTFDAALLKTLSLVKLNQEQKAKISFRNTWQDMFPNEIAQAEQISTGRFRTPPDKGAIEMLEDGKKVVYNVDPYIAEAFEYIPKNNWLDTVVRPVRWLNESVFRPLFITYNPAFTFWSNPNRDFKRMYRNLPEAGLGDVIKGYIDSWQDAKDYSKGNMDNPRLRRLVDEFAIAPPGEGWVFKERGDALGRQMQRFHLLDGDKNWVQKQTEKHKALQWWPKMLSWIRTKGSQIEILPKLAADKILTEKGASDKERAYKIRNYFGTPNFKAGGKGKRISNSLFMFSNIMIQGYKADAQAATAPKTRGAFWMRTAMLDVLPKLLVRGAILGWFGDELKEFYDKATEYDKTNYVVVPLGWQQGGSTGRKPVYLRMPQDESARLVSSMIWKLTGVIAGDPDNDFNQVFDLAADEIPSLAPVFSIAGNWWTFLGGSNPIDDWRDRGILPQRVQDARKVTEGPALKKMVEWTINQTGLTSIATYNPNANNTTEFIMQTAPILNRMIKSTDYGALESQNALEDLENARKQAIRLEYGEDVLRMVSRNYYLSRLGDKRIGSQHMEYQYLNNFYQQVYKPMDELIRQQRDLGNEEKADQLIEDLQEYGTMYETMVDEVKERPKAKAEAAAE